MNRFLLVGIGMMICGGAISNAQIAEPTKLGSDEAKAPAGVDPKQTSADAESGNAEKKPSHEARVERIQIPNADARDVLEFYGQRVRKRVFVAPNIEGGVTVNKSGTREEIVGFIRSALVEQLGLALRVTPDEELLAEWSKDPKFPANRIPPITEAERAMIPKAGDRTAGLKLRSVNVWELIKCYGKAVNKPVFVANDVAALVTLEYFGPRDEIPGLIRSTLLEKYGIAMRETKDGDVLFEWSNDPKYPRRSDPPPANVKPVQPRALLVPKTRVRPISQPPSARP